MQKLVQTFFVFIAFQVLLTAQIPNEGFENWIDLQPDSWYTNNVVIPNMPQFNITPVTQSSESYSGASAVKLEVLLTNPGPNESVVGAVTISDYFPVSEKYGIFSGYFKFLPQSENDSLSIAVIMVDDGIIIGTVIMHIKEAISSYTKLDFPIQYLFADRIPDSVSISISINATSLSNKSSVGSYALVDDISFAGGSATNIEDRSGSINVFELSQNYPNPFNPTTKIKFAIVNIETKHASSLQTTLKVYDILGNEVATLVNEQKYPGAYEVEFNAEELPSGIYLYRLQAESFIQTRKMMFLK